MSEVIELTEAEQARIIESREREATIEKQRADEEKDRQRRRDLQQQEHQQKVQVLIDALIEEDTNNIFVVNGRSVSTTIGERSVEVAIEEHHTGSEFSTAGQE
ncbi:MAG: hypothetical protein DRI37_09280 [Chloroflexi bacterium]|nr:MAG: hypothetical protein DRI37_09280 [Chloroflexota bacterium]